MNAIILFIITFATTTSTIVASIPLVNTFAQNNDTSTPMTSSPNENINTGGDSGNLTGGQQEGSGGALGGIGDKIGGLLGGGENDQSTTGQNSGQDSGGALGGIGDKIGGLLGGGENENR